MRRIAAFALALVLGACGGGEPDAGAAELTPAVYTTFYPTTWMAERIAGGAVPVVCPLPDGADPIYWQPDRDTLAEYQRAALIALNGAGFEKWVDGASLPPSRTVATADGFEDRWLSYDRATTHSHGPGGEHTHAGLDGHTWLDPVLAARQAEALHAAMARTFPAHADAFAQNHRRLQEELGGLDAALTDLASLLHDVALFASHPAYNYLARRYGLEVHNFDFDPAVELTGAQREDLRERITGEHRAHVLLWESEPVEPELGIPGLEGVLFSPGEAAPGPGGPDYLELMEANLARLLAAAAS
ncbi:MAG: metal ABC transporter substrate-binding protein [Planctomycetota bacterium]